jgi:hypothetical protein
MSTCIATQVAAAAGEVELELELEEAAPSLSPQRL